MLKDSLTALLSTIPEVNVISVTNDLDSATTFVLDHQPQVCIIDFSYQGDEITTYVVRMNSKKPKMKIIALVEDIQTKELADSLGIDEVIIKGGKAESLLNAVTEYINRSKVLVLRKS